MVFLVTGANRGLGYELTKAGARLGHTVIAACRARSAELDALAREQSPLVSVIDMDVADTASIESAADRVKGMYVCINGFINNAAVNYGKVPAGADPFTALDIAEMETMININVLGPMRVCKYFLPLVYAQNGRRCVVSITSESAVLKDSFYQLPGYSASKGALNCFTQRLRNYVAVRDDTKDIQVFMIHPGRMNTRMGKESAQIEASESAEGIWALIEGRNPVNAPVPFIDYRGNLMPIPVIS
jgi:NAD(P)-dependent dehydrogenase (short-subunit alcohol dehydrogenase family)